MSFALDICRARVLTALIFALWATAAAAAADSDSKSKAEIDAQVARLIEQLGAERFATREKAQAELEQLGLSAFDALHEAQNHDDIEIALRARYLVRSMRVTWWRSTDSPDVKLILKGYGAQPRDQRRSLMDRLVRLEHSDGIEALCRLVRFENDPLLSKQAALLVMNHDAPEGDDERKRLVAAIRGAIGLSKRPAADWLKLYADTLNDADATMGEWEQLVQREFDVYTQFPEQSKQEILLDLLRWQAELLRGVHRHDEAIAAIRRTFELINGSRKQLLDSVNWLIQRELWTLAEELGDRYWEKFSQSPQLLYRLAEARQKSGAEDKAADLARQALALNAEEPRSHIEAAIDLRERGLMKWAEGEFRRVIELGPAESHEVLFSQSVLSEMLHDQGRQLDAAEVLQVAVDAIDKDPKLLERNNFSRQVGSWRSRAHYFRALHFAELGDREKHLEQLREGAVDDPTDADVLIAMHRVKDADGEWRAQTSKLIASAAEHFRGEIDSGQRDLERYRQQQNQPLVDNAKAVLANSYNQFAWLIGNTEGDYDEAIRFSHRSLELRPDYAAYLDTLGRCYFTKGDLPNAIKHQRRALELEPHSGLMQRQLQTFLDAQAAADKQPDKQPAEN